MFSHVCDSVHGGGFQTGRTPPTRENPPGANPPGQGEPPTPGTRPPRPGRTPPGPGRLPRDQTPLARENPHPPFQDQTPNPPPSQGEPLTPGSRLQHTVYERLVRILLECILVLVITFSLCVFPRFELKGTVDS